MLFYEMKSKREERMIKPSFHLKVMSTLTNHLSHDIRDDSRWSSHGGHCSWYLKKVEVPLVSWMFATDTRNTRVRARGVRGTPKSIRIDRTRSAIYALGSS